MPDKESEQPRIFKKNRMFGLLQKRRPRIVRNAKGQGAASRTSSALLPVRWISMFSRRSAIFAFEA